MSRRSRLTRPTVLAIASLVSSASATSRTAAAQPAVRAATASPFTSPAARLATEAFTETRAGITISDPYRWVEQPERAADWTAWLQQATTQGMAQVASRPARAAWVTALQAATQPGTRYVGLVEVAGKQFVRRTRVGDQGSSLVVRERVNGAWRERVLFAPSATGDTAMNAFSIAPDGETVSLIASAGGSEVGDVRFLSVRTGREVGTRFGPVWGEATPEWLDARRVVLIPLGDASGGNPFSTMVAYVTTLGADRTPIFGYGLPGVQGTTPPESPAVAVLPGGKWTLALGVGARADARVLISPTSAVAAGQPQWRPMADYDDRVNYITASGDRLYLLTTRTQSGGEVLTTTMQADGRPGPMERVAVGDSVSITMIAATTDGLYMAGTQDGAASIRFLPNGSRTPVSVPLPFEASVEALRVSPDGKSVTTSLVGWTQPRVFYALRAGRLQPLGLASSGWTPARTLSVRRLQARSADGTMVPMVVIRRPGVRGPQPTVIDAYGSYGVPTAEPLYAASWLAWASSHTLVYCGTRGGNERGRAWHDAGREANKKNAHADLIACGEALVQQGLTTPAMLAVTATSAGGLLGPIAALQRPDLFRAVVARVAILNATRLEAMANGPNQYAEMGDPATEAGFRALVAQDAVLTLQQRLTADARYVPPAMLVTVGLNDQRVAPWMPAKFAATALAAAGDRQTILVRADGRQGHGIGSGASLVVEETADVFTFLEGVLGVRR